MLKVGQFVTRNVKVYVTLSLEENGMVAVFELDSAFKPIGKEFLFVSELSLVSEDWLSNGSASNLWYMCFPLLQDVLQAIDFSWTTNFDFKYVNYRIDTRHNHFTISDRDGNVRSPLDMLNSPSG